MLQLQVVQFGSMRLKIPIGLYAIQKQEESLTINLGYAQNPHLQ